MIRAGVLSDTHIKQPDSQFCQWVQDCFHHCDVIIHAGDLTALPVLVAFGGRTVYAVSGNMCESAVRQHHPEWLQFSLGRFTIGLTHGARLGLNLEDSLWQQFPEADCIIFGHTHRAYCQRYGSTLFLNPGSFQATGRYGAAGTYAILEISETLTAQIHQVPRATP